MSGILAVVLGKLGWIGAGAATGVALAIAAKTLPKMFGKFFADKLGDGLSSIDKIEDPKEKELVHNIAVAVVKWAEYKIPDAGQGRARFDAAAAKLCALLPFLKGQDKKVADIIEGAVAAMDSELKKVTP